MSRLRYGKPLWLGRRRARRPAYPSQRGRLQVEVAIVGGGMTGALAAYLFSRAGVRVAVLEAARVARGSTAASSALLMQEPDRDFLDLAERYGRAAARDIWRALASATRGLADAIHAEHIDCDFHVQPSVYFTRDAVQAARLERELRARHLAGLPGRWLPAVALLREAGIAGAGAIETRGNAQMNPVKACRGFLSAAAANGAQVFERSPVLGTTAGVSHVTMRTPAGRVRADKVIVATGYLTPQFKPLAGRFRMKDTFVLATRRLPRRARTALVKTPLMLWDTNRPYYYMRWSDDGRLLVGGADVDHEGGARPGRLARGRRELLEYLGRVYPALAGERAAFAWEGLFAETADGLPYVGEHRRYPRHYFALGYGGNGMAASFLAAQLLLRRYRNHPDPRERLFAFSRDRAPRHP